MPANDEESAKERVADVLKSGLERQLVADEDAVQLAGHGSHIVTQVEFAGQDDSQAEMGWDDEKFREFTERLSELHDSGSL